MKSSCRRTSLYPLSPRAPFGTGPFQRRDIQERVRPGRAWGPRLSSDIVESSSSFVVVLGFFYSEKQGSLASSKAAFLSECWLA